MLQLKEISKKYKTGELVQKALNKVSLNLRDNEFVAILGPSGSGKTTLLNVIGGLDRYDTGNLIINGISTEKYSDGDWDAYRNHTIGFVFQSYNLIAHQSVLSNVELALTIGGLSKAERRQKAVAALEAVGLGNQLHKKPNQMSGGQMQRVAIARALVNDPDVLLADEPTGALDSETSVQVMELLKEVAKSRLVVMVTHNPELAAEYATRIVRLRDGNIVGDSDPFVVGDTEMKQSKIGTAKMDFRTSLSLSFNNLLTKKGRTLLTSFAGSIGIIGIALILALSNGVNSYINDIQKQTMSSYPVTISSETIDLTGMMETMASGGDMSAMSSMSGMGAMGGVGMSGKVEVKDPSLSGVYANNSELEVKDFIVTSLAENDLTSFKKYLDDPNSEIRQYLGENGIVYTYSPNFEVYSYDKNGQLVNSNTSASDISDTSFDMGSMSGMSSMMSMMSMRSDMMTEMMSSMLGSGSQSDGAKNFSELMKGSDGSVVSSVVTDNYDVLYGAWPQNYNEVVLVLDTNNAIDTGVLYQLGLVTASEYEATSKLISQGQTVEPVHFDYATVCGHSFYLVPACDRYVKNADGTFSLTGEITADTLQKATMLKISGIIRPKDGATNATIMTSVAYTSLLTDHIINYVNSSEIILAQEAAQGVDVLNGTPFEVASDEEKAQAAKTYIASLSDSEKASLYQMIAFLGAMDGSESSGGMGLKQMISAFAGEKILAYMMDIWVSNSADTAALIAVYDQYIKTSSYEDNMKQFGRISYDAPDSISIFTDSFEDKEGVSACIESYNEAAGEDGEIVYVDYVQLMTSSLTTIIDVISYVLIAFVGVSLVVSCIMIGIITHISVLERTKEIGILRALGASKKNISQVFNAETIIVGFCAGILGTGVSMLMTIPINNLLRSLLGVETVNAKLPLVAAAALVAVSVIITVIGGLIPSKKAAKKDPVIALRTE